MRRIRNLPQRTRSAGLSRRKEVNGKLEYTFPCISSLYKRKRRISVARVLEALLKNSSCLHESCLCKTAEVSAQAVMGQVSASCRSLWRQQHGCELHSPTLLLNQRSLRLCARAVTLSILGPPFSLVGFFPYIGAECSVVCQEARRAEC